MGEIEKVIDKCTECGICLNECDFLQKYSEFPRELAVKYKNNDLTGIIPYSCNICGLCKLRCPLDLDIGKMFIEIRQQLVKCGLGPLPEHASIVEAQEFYISDEFKTVIPSGDESTKRIFFPGCSLSAYSPDLVKKTYEYLDEKLGETGIMLGCCGGPAYLTGDHETSYSISQDMIQEVEKVKAREIIVACPFCYGLLKQNYPDMKFISLFVILNKIGIPARITESTNSNYNIHDPCTARFQTEIQDSVRSIVKKLGYNTVEIAHSKDESHCCGMGGMVYAVDEELGKLKSMRTLDETEYDTVTYCATCRETLQGQGGRVLHVLDLIFNQDLDNASNVPPNSPETTIENLKSLKSALIKNHSYK